MGIFDKIFGGTSESKEEKTLPWIDLISTSQLDDIETKSKTKTQVIFKHSTNCGISRMVKRQFEMANDEDLNVDLYYLDLIAYREVSNETANKFQVVHESPQLLIIKNGTVVKHTSHGGINDVDLKEYLT